MFAVIKTGGKQYKVAKNDVVTVEKLAGEVGASVSLDDVLLVGGDGAASVGSPGVDKARVTAEVVEQGKNRTITVFKKKRRKNYRRSNGHRQLHTKLRITDIALDGKSAGEGDAEKARQATQKAGAKSQKQATQKAATEKSKAKSATSKTRSTQGTAAKSGQSKSAKATASKSTGSKSSASKSSGSKAGASKSASGKSAGGAKSGSSKSGGKSSGGSRAKKSEE